MRHYSSHAKKLLQMGMEACMAANTDMDSSIVPRPINSLKKYFASCSGPHMFRFDFFFGAALMCLDQKRCKRPRHAQRIHIGTYPVMIGISTPARPETRDINRPREEQPFPNAVTFLYTQQKMDLNCTTLATTTGIYPYHQLLSQSRTA
jgi:hypothetical protein